MALTDKLASIANAIRSKTGSTDAMSLDQMVTEIEGISAGGGTGGGISTATVGDLKLFDVIHFGRWDGNELYWFVSDTDYEGHIIITAMPESSLHLTFCSTSADVDNNVKPYIIYRLSSLRQFLNSESEVWFSEKYVGDVPTEYSSKSGFLYDFTQKEKDSIDLMEIKALEYKNASNYTIETFNDRVWVPSLKQCGGEAGTAEGSTALKAARMSTSVFGLTIDGYNIFRYTRTPMFATGVYKDRISSGYNHYMTYFKPISVSLKKDTVVSGYQTPETGLYLWEV